MGCTEEVLEYPRTSASIVASPVLRRVKTGGGESCIVLESGLTRGLVAKFPQHSSLEVREFRAASEERYERRVCAKV